MKLRTLSLFAVIAAAPACANNPPPQAAHVTPSTAPTQTALVATAEPANTQLAPGAPAIPNNPEVAPPKAPAAEPGETRPLTLSPTFASPRPDAVPPVATDPTLDKPQTVGDEESVREIRALLAADKSLSTTARQITIIAHHGRVRLTGQVNTAEERAAIERSARKAANVIDVQNQLVVLE